MKPAQLGWLGLATLVVGFVIVAFSDVAFRVSGHLDNGIDPHSYDVVGTLVTGFGFALIGLATWRSRKPKLDNLALAWQKGADWAAAMVADGNDETHIRACFNENPYPRRNR